MTGVTHRRVGACTATIIATVAVPASTFALLLIPAAYLTSTLPDRLERWVPAFLPWRWRPRLVWALIPLRVRVIPLKHRCVTHYPETTALLALGLAVAAATVHPVLGVLATGAAIGVLMHLAADACTVSGLPTFTHTICRQPQERVHLLPPGFRVRTGTRTEHIVRLVVTAATGLIVAAIVYFQDGRAPELDWRIAAGAAAVLLLLTAPARALIRGQRVKVAWTQAVIHSGAADPPGKRSRKKAQFTGPRATSVKPVAVGDQVTVRISRGNSYPNLEQHRDTIRNNLDVGHLYNQPVHDLRLRPHPYRSSRAIATIITRDPFLNAPPTSSPLVDLEQTSVMRDPCPVGTFETGQSATITWAPGRAGHILICGITEGGKSAFVQQLIAHTALDPSARLVLLDPQMTQFARWQSCAALPVVGANPVDAVRALKTVRTVLGQQLATLAARGTWTPTSDDPTYTVVIDEAALYLRKDDLKNSRQFASLLLDLLQRARAGGVRIITLTQRPSGEVFPTDLRAQYPWRVCFRVNEPETTQMVFGSRHEAPAHEIPKHGYQGVGFLDTETDRPERFRGHYLTPQQIQAIADRAAGARLDHDLTQLTAPLPLSSPSPRPKAADLRAQRDRERLLEVLPVTPPGLARDELERAVGPWPQIKRTLDGLVKDGRVVRDGAGRSGDPFRYRATVHAGARHLARPGNDGLEPNGGGVHGSPT